jgi:hypothetical protein
MARIGKTFASELLAAGISTEGIAWTDDGKLIFTDVPAEIQATAETVLEAHNPDALPGYAERRREAYVAAGVTMEAIAEALIEHAGGRSQKLQQLMLLRDAVRAEIPKP